jgi:hypothetical protein
MIRIPLGSFLPGVFKREEPSSVHMLSTWGLFGSEIEADGAVRKLMPSALG